MATESDHILALLSSLTFGLHGENTILNKLEIINHEGTDLLGHYKGGMPQLTADLRKGFGVDCAIFVQLYSMLSATLDTGRAGYTLPTPLFGLGVYASVVSTSLSERHPGTERAYLTSDNPKITEALTNARQDCVGQWLVRHPNEDTWAGMSTTDGPIRLPLSEWEDRLRKEINKFVKDYADAPLTIGMDIDSVLSNLRCACAGLIRQEMSESPLEFRLFPNGLPSDEE